MDERYLELVSEIVAEIHKSKYTHGLDNVCYSNIKDILKEKEKENVKD